MPTTEAFRSETSPTLREWDVDQSDLVHEIATFDVDLLINRILRENLGADTTFSTSADIEPPDAEPEGESLDTSEVTGESPAPRMTGYYKLHGATSWGGLSQIRGFSQNPGRSFGGSYLASTRRLNAVGIGRRTFANTKFGGVTAATAIGSAALGAGLPTFRALGLTSTPRRTYGGALYGIGSNYGGATPFTPVLGSRIGAAQVEGLRDVPLAPRQAIRPELSTIRPAAPVQDFSERLARRNPLGEDDSMRSDEATPYPSLAKALREGRISSASKPALTSRVPLPVVEPSDSYGEADQVGFGRSGDPPDDFVTRPRTP